MTHIFSPAPRSALVFFCALRLRRSGPCAIAGPNPGNVPARGSDSSGGGGDLLPQGWCRIPAVILSAVCANPILNNSAVDRTSVIGSLPAGDNALKKNAVLIERACTRYVATP